MLPTANPEIVTLAVPLTTGTVIFPTVTLPIASDGKTTLTVAFSPSVTVSALTFMVAFFFGGLSTSNIAKSLDGLYLSSPEYMAITT